MPSMEKTPINEKVHTQTTQVYSSTWMKSWEISAASEQKQRAMMKADLENMSVEAEGVPFSFNIKRGRRELRPAPLAYISDFKSLVFHLLEEKDRLRQIFTSL